MKKSIFISLLVAAMGVMMFVGCKRDIDANDMYAACEGQWKCIDNKYSSDDDEILLRFSTDSVYIDVNTKYKCAFPKGCYKYDFFSDTLCIYLENYNMSYIYSINNNKKRMSLNYTGTVAAPANDPLPELIYNFRKLK